MLEHAVWDALVLAAEEPWTQLIRLGIRHQCKRQRRRSEHGNSSARKVTCPFRTMANLWGKDVSGSSSWPQMRQLLISSGVAVILTTCVNLGIFVAVILTAFVKLGSVLKCIVAVTLTAFVNLGTTFLTLFQPVRSHKSTFPTVKKWIASRSPGN